MHSSGILTQELCEDDSLFLKIQDTSRYFCGLDSVKKKKGKQLSYK